MSNEYRIAGSLTLISAFVCLLFFELGSRVFIYSRTPEGIRFQDDIVFEYLPDSAIQGITMNNIGCIGDDVLIGKERKKEEKQILLLGGSTSFSQFYVDRLRASLKAKYPNLSFRVTSCGRPRYTSYINYNVLKKVAPLAKPDLVVIYMGINDNIYNTFPWLEDLPAVGFFNWKSTNTLLFWELFKYYVVDKKFRSTPDFKEVRSKNIFQKNLEKIVALAKEHEAEVLLATFAISYPTEDEKLLQHLRAEEAKMEHFWGKIEATAQGVQEHNDVVRNTASKMNISLAEVEQTIPRDEAHFIDMCHMTETGYEIMVEKLVEKITLY